jgi:hypothetical protein
MRQSGSRRMRRILFLAEKGVAIVVNLSFIAKER